MSSQKTGTFRSHLSDNHRVNQELRTVMLLASRIRHGSELSDMRYRALAAALAVLFSVAPSRAQTRAITLPLDSTEELKPVNVSVESVTYKGRKALRVT